MFHAGTVLGLPFLRRFLPACSPRILSVPGVLRVVSPLARRDFEDVSITRIRCCRAACLALATLAPSLDVIPFEVLTFTASSHASAGLLSWASPVSVRLPCAPIARSARHSSGFSLCSSECQRSEKLAPLLPSSLAFASSPRSHFASLPGVFAESPSLLPCG